MTIKQDLIATALLFFATVLLGIGGLYSLSRTPSHIEVEVGECLAPYKGDFGVAPPPPAHIDKVVAMGEKGLTENVYVFNPDTGKWTLSSENAPYEWYVFDDHKVIECPEEVK